MDRLNAQAAQDERHWMYAAWKQTMTPAATVETGINMTDATGFADRLRQRRLDLGISQDELASLVTAAGAPIVGNAVWKWESGNSRPRRNKLGALAVALEVEESTVVSWWAGQDTDSADGAPVGPRTAEVARRMDDLSPEAWIAIRMLIEADEHKRAAEGDR